MADKRKKSTSAVTEDAENFLKDFWGKVVEYASLGAEEASKVSSTAKTRVDIETLKFKRGKLAKILGERFYDEWLKDSGAAVTGTRDLLRQIKRLDTDLKKLEKEMSRTPTKARSKPGATAKTKPKTRRKTGSKTSTTKKPAKKRSDPETSTTAKPEAEG